MQGETLKIIFYSYVDDNCVVMRSGWTDITIYCGVHLQSWNATQDLTEVALQLSPSLPFSYQRKM